MPIQKPTVTDAARICGELNRYKDDIVNAIRGLSTPRQLWLEFKKSEIILKYFVGKQAAYMGIEKEIPIEAKDIFPGAAGCLIVEARQINNDRIISVVLSKKDRLGRDQISELIFELIPSIGDCFYIAGNGNMKGILSGKRIKSYESPAPLNKPTLQNIEKHTLEKIIGENSDIMKEVYGLNPRDVLNLSFKSDMEPDDILHDMRTYYAKAVEPGPAWIISDGDDYSGYSLVRPKLRDEEIALEFESALKMYETYYSGAIADYASSDRLKYLRKIIRTELTKARRKTDLINEKLADSEKAELYKTYGDLILANIGNIGKGAESVILGSGEDGRTYKIELDPAKPPSVNAAMYFKKSKKARTGKKKLQQRLDEAVGRANTLETLAARADENVEELETGLLDLGLIAEKTGKRKQVEPRKPYWKFKAGCGWDILVGKSNRDNDELTFHIASKHDYWFHAWQSAGSHTVLRLPDKSTEPDKQTLLEAAGLAAFYSKARHSSKVAVAYTQVKYVRKPRKFPPGKVLVEREKQLMVKPLDPEKL